jgi:phosphoglucosamine mutase
MKKFPQTLVNVKTNGKLDLDNHNSLNKVLRTVNSGLGKNGRVLIRPSGTEPLVRVMVECDDADLANKSAKQLAKALKS